MARILRLGFAIVKRNFLLALFATGSTMGKDCLRRKGVSVLTAEIRVYSDPELKRLAGERADKENVPLSELVVRALATYLHRPDLAEVPRKKMGRPRKVR